MVSTIAGSVPVQRPGDAGKRRRDWRGGANLAPNGIAVDGSGNVYVADSYNHTIRKITAGGVVTTFAGAAGSAGFADGTGASAARFNYPEGVALDASGNVFVCRGIRQ